MVKPLVTNEKRNPNSKTYIHYTVTLLEKGLGEKG